MGTTTADLLGLSFNATEVSIGNAEPGISIGSSVASYVYTESSLLATNSLIGPGATATVTAVSGTSVTVTLSNAATSLANGQQITGTLIGNNASEILLEGSVPGVGSSYVYVSNTAAEQPGVGQTAFVDVPYGSATYVPACYCAGTLILTEAGEVAVEALAIGDRVITASGERKPIRWIGQRSYGGRFLAGRPELHPICLRAGALGDCVPKRDLFVSPRHAMYLDGVLVPAQELLNGATVVRHRSDEAVSYYHIELDDHDIILAEGAASESFVDDDSRMIFHNADGFAGRPAEPAVFCAPRVTEGYALHAIRTEIAARAGLVTQAA